MNNPSGPEENNISTQERIAVALERIAAALEHIVTTPSERFDMLSGMSDNIMTSEDMEDDDTESQKVVKIIITSEEAIEDDMEAEETVEFIMSPEDSMEDNDDEQIFREKKVEKRKHPRKPCSIVVDYATQDRAFRDYIRDISKSGVFIETTNFFSVGQEFIMTFSIPNNQKPLKFIGEVVRTGQRGVGVKFKRQVNIDSEQQ